MDRRRVTGEVSISMTVTGEIGCKTVANGIVEPIRTKAGPRDAAATELVDRVEDPILSGQRTATCTGFTGFTHRRLLTFGAKRTVV